MMLAATDPTRGAGARKTRDDTIELRMAAVPLGLEHCPDQAANGASGNGNGAAPAEVQVFILNAAGNSAVLVGADLIWFSSQQAEYLRGRIAELTGVQAASIALCATHTHGTPNSDERFFRGQWSAAFAEMASDAVLRAVGAAREARAQRVRVMVGSAKAAGIAINRRRSAWLRRGLRLQRRVQNMPNPTRPLDDRVTIIAFVSEGSGKLAALATHFTCHPVADPSNRRGADFPGFMRQALRHRLGSHFESIFLQGFCGDVRPALIHKPRGVKDRLIELLIGSRFRPSHLGDAEQIGDRLAESVMAALVTARPVAPIALISSNETIGLLDIDGAATGRQLGVTVWRLSDKLRIVFASAEMLSGLAPADPNTLAVGYANGMVGYIAPASDYAGGGYEIDGFLPGFGLKKRFDPGIGAAFARFLATASP
jgi:hypothetical protein